MFVVLVISLAAGGYLLVGTRTGQSETDLEQLTTPVTDQLQIPEILLLKTLQQDSE